MFRWTPTRAPIRATAALALLTALPGAAHADRHCLPVLDGYYAARLDLEAEATTCETRRAHARDTLEAAGTDAQICGCAALTEALEELITIAGDDNMACGEAVTALLDAEARMDETVRDCQ